MTCEEALVLISGHLDGENTEQEEAQMQAHLEVCPSCREILEALSQMDLKIQNLEVEPPTHFCENVMAAIRAEQVPVRKKKHPIWPVLTTAAAAALLLAVGVSTLPKPAAQAADEAEPMLARSAEDTMEFAVYDAADEDTENKMAVTMYAAVPSGPDPQTLAEERSADVAVSYELLPELEGRDGEALEDGAVLYALDSAGAAVQLSRIYGLALYEPEEASADVSYVLVIS